MPLFCLRLNKIGFSIGYTTLTLLLITACIGTSRLRAQMPERVWNKAIEEIAYPHFRPLLRFPLDSGLVFEGNYAYSEPTRKAEARRLDTLMSRQAKAGGSHYLFPIGQLMLKFGKTADASLVFHRLIELRTQQEELKAREEEELIEVFFLMGQYQKALSYLKQSAHLPSAKKKLLEWKAQLWLGNCAQAQTLYKGLNQALRDDPNYSIEFLNRALLAKSNPSCQVALHSMVREYLNQRQHSKNTTATDSLFRAAAQAFLLQISSKGKLEGCPDCTPLYPSASTTDAQQMQRGVAALLEHKEEVAIAAFEVLMETQPDFIPAHENRLFALYLSKNQAAYQEAVQSFMNDFGTPQAYLLMGTLMLEDEAMGKFLDLLRVVEERYAFHHGFQYWLAVSAIKSNSFEEALSWSSKALRKMDDKKVEGTLHYIQALCHIGLGQQENAATALKKAAHTCLKAEKYLGKYYE